MKFVQMMNGQTRTCTYDSVLRWTSTTTASVSNTGAGGTCILPVPLHSACTGSAVDDGVAAVSISSGMDSSNPVAAFWICLTYFDKRSMVFGEPTISTGSGTAGKDTSKKFLDYSIGYVANKGGNKKYLVLHTISNSNIITWTII